MNRLKIKLLIFMLTIFGSAGFVFADEYTSTSFDVSNPVITSGGTYSSSNNFQLFGTISQLAIGTSTATDFEVRSGFFYYPAATAAAAAAVSATAASAGASGGIALDLLKKFLKPIPVAYIPPTCVSTGPDFNCDKKVDLADLSIFLYLSSQPAPNPADFDRDGVVGSKDLSILFSQWTEPVLAFIPEKIAVPILPLPLIPGVPKPEEVKPGMAAVALAAPSEEAIKTAGRGITEEIKNLASKLIPKVFSFISKTAVQAKTFFGKIRDSLKSYIIKLLLTKRASAANPAGLFLTPASGTFIVGSTFELSVVLDTKGTAVNTVEAELLFPPDKLQIASPSVGLSVIQIWPGPPAFSNREGRIYFVGGIPSPGINTSSGIVLTLTFRVVAPGSAEVKFRERTSVLANDGRGTNILGQSPSAFFKLQIPPPQGPIVSSPTHPDQEKWYQNPNPVFVWPESRFADGYSWFIDHNPSGFPDTISKSAASVASFENIGNGIWYFHLRERAGGVWGGVSHYVIKIDRDPPAAFKINVSPSLRTTNQNPILRFFTTDALSGLDYFEMKIIPLTSEEFANEALFFGATSPYQATNLKPGRYQVIVRATDKAGNTRDEAVTLSIVGSLTQFLNPEGIDLVFVFLPWPQVIAIGAAIFLIIFVLLLILWLKHKRHLPHAFREDVLKVFDFFREPKK